MLMEENPIVLAWIEAGKDAHDIAEMLDMMTGQIICDAGMFHVLRNKVQDVIDACQMELAMAVKEEEDYRAMVRNIR